MPHKWRSGRGNARLSGMWGGGWPLALVVLGSKGQH